MPGTVITITSGKGGVGKSTTVANLSTALAMMGQKVAVVDADIGLRNLDIVLGLESRIIYDLFDVVEGRCTVAQALVRDRRVPALYLLPAAQTRDKADISIEQMVRVCHELGRMVDFVLIDSPAGIEHGFQAAVAPAERVLIVTSPDVSALRDADKVIYLLERDWKFQPWLVLNRYNEEMARSGDMRNIDDVLDILAIDLLGVIPESRDVVISTDRGIPAVYNKSALARQAYLNIARRILGQNVPLMSFTKRGFFYRIRRMFGGR